VSTTLISHISVRSDCFSIAVAPKHWLRRRKLLSLSGWITSPEYTGFAGSRYRAHLRHNRLRIHTKRWDIRNKLEIRSGPRWHESSIGGPTSIDGRAGGGVSLTTGGADQLEGYNSNTPSTLPEAMVMMRKMVRCLGRNLQAQPQETEMIVHTQRQQMVESGERRNIRGTFLSGIGHGQMVALVGRRQVARWGSARNVMSLWPDNLLEHLAERFIWTASNAG
jgi:hypothetical protein